MPLPITNRLKEAVEYVNYFYYSKEMTANKFMGIKRSSSLTFIRGDEPNDAAVPLRVNHGILHAMAAMESISNIHDSYEKNYANYVYNLEHIALYFHINSETLLEYVQLAALFSNTGKQSDAGIWDEASAENCKKYMIEKLGVEENLATYISDTIRYKNNLDLFLEKHKDISIARNFLHNEIDIVHQLVNTANMLEEMCHQNIVEPSVLPIAQHVRSVTMQVEVIPNLIVPHRQRIIDEGRNRCEARIENCSPIRFNDSEYVSPPQGTDKQLYSTYLRQNQKYDLTVENITLDNLDRVVQRVLRGIATYRANNNISPKLRLHKQSMFDLRFHGKAGESRAAYFQRELSDATKAPYEKVKILYAIFSNKDGLTLKEEIMRSFNNMNEESLRNQLSALLQTLANANNDEIQAVNDQVVRMIRRSTSQ